MSILHKLFIFLSLGSLYLNALNAKATAKNKENVKHTEDFVDADHTDQQKKDTDGNDSQVKTATSDTKSNNPKVKTTKKHSDTEISVEQEIKSLINYKGFGDLVEEVNSCVVSIQAIQEIDPRQKIMIEGSGMENFSGIPQNHPFAEIFKDFFDQMLPKKMQSVGSGFIVKIDDKSLFIITNQHVINNAKNVTITFYNKAEAKAEIHSFDARNDIAILKVDLSNIAKDKQDFKAIQWGDSDKSRVGDWVIAVGSPFNFGNTVTSGIISFKGRYVANTLQQHDFEYIQHSASINVGSSGGALFDTEGKVIGVNNAIITNTGGNIGIGFAIPSNVAKKITEQLFKFGKILRGHLGIRIQKLDSDMAESQGLKEGGVIVGSVIENGPSAKILKEGDIILSLNDQKISECHNLSQMVSSLEIGSVAKIKIWRKGKEQVVNIKVQEAPEAKTAKENSKDKQSLNIAGIEVANLSAEIIEKLESEGKKANGILIINIDNDSPATDNNFLSRQDIIIQANNKDINDVNDFKSVIEEARKQGRQNVLLLVQKSNNNTVYIPLKINASDKPKEELAKEDNEKVNKALAKSDNMIDNNPKNQKQVQEAVSDFFKGFFK